MSWHRLVPGCLSIVALSALVIICASRAYGNATLFFQNFDSLQLLPSESYTPTVPNAFTHSPPAGWTNDASGVPTGSGRPEWRGWSFARKDFWIDVGGSRRREFFLAQNTIAMADPAEWNEIGDPANNLGFYDAVLRTQPIDLATQDTGAKKLSFDSSWFPQCCDDGKQFDPKMNNQTAILELLFPNGTKREILHWESAPYYRTNPMTGERIPSLNPNDTANEFFKAAAPNEKILIDLSPYLNQVSFAQVRLQFSLINAGADGWWGFDTARMFSLSLVPGDMNIDGIVDEKDIPAFALGVQSTDQYRNTYFGEFPVVRGSPDGTFDFDDIPWFVNLLESSGVGSAAELVHAALNIPEPSSAAIVTAALAFGTARRVRRAAVIR